MSDRLRGAIIEFQQETIAEWNDPAKKNVHMIELAYGFADKLEALIAAEVDKARLDEVKRMPHQYDPELEHHTMSDTEIPKPINCQCYKGRRLAQLNTQEE